MSTAAYMNPGQASVERAYQLIREQIINLELAPGSPINEKYLAEHLELDLFSVQEALKLLAHDNLVVITPRHVHGTYVAHAHLAELDQLSQVRIALESLSARLAAALAGDEDLAALESLREEYAIIPQGDSERLFDVDHRFHQTVAKASRNKYLAATLERFFGLSQRLWNMALSRLDFLHDAVQEHFELIEAINNRETELAAQIMHRHVEGFYNRVRKLLTVEVSVNYGDKARSVVVDENSLVGAAVIATDLPLEQPCAGKGTCHKCKVIVHGALNSADKEEIAALTEAERLAGYRLACRARLEGNATITLAPIVVYSNKIFQMSDDHKDGDAPLGLAIDLGTTTVAAFLVALDTGRVCMGAAALNQQTAFGADVMSRIAAAQSDVAAAERLGMLALSSIVQAIAALKLSAKTKGRIQKATIVGNSAMHHLLLSYPVSSLAVLPFQPHNKEALTGNVDIFTDVFPKRAEVSIPPLIGGFVGSDALACLVYYDFDRAAGPMAAIDLGTNGEVMVTDGVRIFAASTAAGPAFEGVNISCGTRAVDGAIVAVKANDAEGTLTLTTIGEQPPVGLTGSGLLDLVCELRRLGVVDSSGRFSEENPIFYHRLSRNERNVRRFLITDEAVDLRGFEPGEEGAKIPLYLTQHDIRELQKAKAAIRAALATLMEDLNLQTSDLQRFIITGSFGSQLKVESVLALGMLPQIALETIETSPNGAGFGAAMLLNHKEFERCVNLAARTEQINLDQNTFFNQRFIESLTLRRDH